MNNCDERREAALLELGKIQKRTRLRFYAAIGNIVFCLLAIIIAPLFVENFLWQVMLLPIVVETPVAVMNYRMTRDSNGIFQKHSASSEQTVEGE